MGKGRAFVALGVFAVGCARTGAGISPRLGAPMPGPGDPIHVLARRVPLNPTDYTQSSIGPLRFRGGLALSSRSLLFGGLSDLRVDADGEGVVGITDEGSWWRGRLVYDTNGFLADFTDPRVGHLRDPQGQPLRGKSWQDAESLTRLVGGALVVGFERHHRLWQYGAASLDGRAHVFAPPLGLDEAPWNGGVEALTTLRDGRLLALTEEFKDPKDRGAVRGWVRCGSEWSQVAYRYEGGLRPVGAATLPGSGDVLVLERAFSDAAGVRIRIQRVREASIRPGAVLEGTTVARLARPLTVDNFEGIDIREGPGGESLIYLVSDDNFSAKERTLLLMFALEEGPGPPTGKTDPGSTSAKASVREAP